MRYKTASQTVPAAHWHATTRGAQDRQAMGSTESRYSQPWCWVGGRDLYLVSPEMGQIEQSSVRAYHHLPTPTHLILTLRVPRFLLCPCPRYKEGQSGSQSQASGVSWGLKETEMSWLEELSSSQVTRTAMPGIYTPDGLSHLTPSYPKRHLPAPPSIKSPQVSPFHQLWHSFDLSASQFQNCTAFDQVPELNPY